MRSAHGTRRLQTWKQEYAGHACGKARSLLQHEQVGDKIGKGAWGLTLKDIEHQNEELGFHGELLKLLSNGVI